MSNTNKMTKLQVVEQMLADEAIVANATFKEFLESTKTQLIKKRDNKKPTKAQTENESIMNILIEAMENLGTKGTVTDIWASSADLQSYSNQKLSALMKILVERGKVVKVIEKGKSLFELADSNEEADSDEE